MPLYIWKGDRVLYIGDYVDEYYDNSEYGKTLKDLVQETDTYVLYQVPFKEIKDIEIPQEPIATRYIVNHNTKEYIDLKDQPIQYMYHDSNSNILYSTKIHPLSLMLCASNGAGGSYFGINQEYVGKWVNDLGNIEIMNLPLYESQYNKLEIIFDENNTTKSNMEILKDAIKDIAKNTTKVENLRFDSNLFLTYEEKQELLEFAKECKQIRLSEEYKENVIKPKEENNIDDDYDEPDI